MSIPWNGRKLPKDPLDADIVRVEATQEFRIYRKIRLSILRTENPTDEQLTASNKAWANLEEKIVKMVNTEWLDNVIAVIQLSADYDALKAKQDERFL